MALVCSQYIFLSWDKDWPEKDLFVFWSQVSETLEYLKGIYSIKLFSSISSGSGEVTTSFILASIAHYFNQVDS